MVRDNLLHYPSEYFIKAFRVQMMFLLDFSGRLSILLKQVHEFEQTRFVTLGGKQLNEQNLNNLAYNIIYYYMSTLSTFPNKFRSDGSTRKSNLTYSFAASVDLSQNSTRPPKLEGSKYLSVLVPNQIANVLFDITEYSFQGLYITKQKTS